MFISLAFCCCEPRTSVNGPPTQTVVGSSLDLITGLAAVVIGILATQFGFFGFLPSGVGYGLLGGGIAYSFGFLCVFGLILKDQVLPQKYLFSTYERRE